MHRAVSFGDRVHGFVSHANLDGCFGRHFSGPVHVGHDAEVIDGKKFPFSIQRRFHEHAHGGFRRFKFVALVLELFDPVQRRLQSFLVLGDVQVHFLGFVQQIASPGKLRDENAARVADLFGKHVLIGRGIPDHGADVHSSLVRKSAFAHKRKIFAVRQIRYLAYEFGCIRQELQVFRADSVCPIFNSRFGMMEHRFALPQRSP